MFSTELVVQTFISGVMIGVLYALMALGITFIYSIMRMINWAMGEFYMIGSYMQYALVALLLGPDLWWLAIPISAAGVFAFGLVVQWSLLKPIFRKPPEARDDYATVVTLALLLLLRSLATGLAGPNQFSPGSNLPVVMVGPMPLAGARVAAFVFALAALALFYCLLRYSWYGLALRATSQSRIGVQTAGIDVQGVDRIAFGVGVRSEEHTSELQSQFHLVCRLLLEKKKHFGIALAVGALEIAEHDDDYWGTGRNHGGSASIFHLLQILMEGILGDGEILGFYDLHAD